MKNAIVQYGFLDEDLYRDLRDTYPDHPTSGFRSHYDIPHISDNFPAKWPWFELTRFLSDKKRWVEIVGMFSELRTFTLDDYSPSSHEGYTGERTPETKQYFRMDIGFGCPGYGIHNGGKGNHIDNANRVISGLLYFTDQSECDGGEFELTDKEGNTIQRIKLRENMCIMSVQNGDGWHRVNPLKACKSYRRAVYFALSDTRNIFNR